mgnify:FL=1
MSINIWTDSMQHAALLGKPVLFTNWLIQRDIIPDGWYCYDLRGTHKSPSTRTTLVDHAADYHAGTVLSPIPLKHEGTASRRVNGTFYLLGEEMTLEQFCEEHDLAYPQDNREFVLRPASLDEVGLFYSEEKLDEVKTYAAMAYTALGCEGLARCDFFVEKGTGRVMINEINTFPGFTSISMYPKLMEHEGLPVPALIDRLIELALERTEKQHG